MIARSRELASFVEHVEKPTDNARWGGRLFRWGTEMTAHQKAPVDAQVMRAGEIQALVDRLLSRGLSRLMTDRPESQRDLRTAARVIQALASDRFRRHHCQVNHEHVFSIHFNLPAQKSRCARLSAGMPRLMENGALRHRRRQRTRGMRGDGAVKIASYVASATAGDETRPGIKPIMDYLKSLPWRPDLTPSNCEPVATI
jgi:hypothetical protein